MTGLRASPLIFIRFMASLFLFFCICHKHPASAQTQAKTIFLIVLIHPAIISFWSIQISPVVTSRFRGAIGRPARMAYQRLICAIFVGSAETNIGR